MDLYLLIKNAHIVLALSSGIGFALRGHLRIVLDRPLSSAAMRIAPHVIDTFLLASGITLWVMTGWPFLSWLGLKIGLILVYIVTAGVAMRVGHCGRGVILYLAAMGLFVGIAATALYKPIY